ncbi:MAG: molybdenum cofactor guanylyltransferase [Chloroflexota bacterium]|nr:molybdenum cofactor guanylyltransferase [Chloroflexota bacterium]
MEPEEITAIVLCGGSGARLGDADKPMTRIKGRRLVEYVIAALTPQVDRFVISCGRDRASYETLGHPTVADVRPGDGPLGGIVSALPCVETDWILTHPGDAPFADASLVARLAPAAVANGIAVPRAGDYRQNLVLLISRSKVESLARFYRDGGRAVRHWLDDQGVESVDMTDVADSFFNINTAADLATCERRLSSPG